MRTYIIIVNYYCHNYVFKCLQSIEKNNCQKKLKVLVVDNSANEVEFAALKEVISEKLNKNLDINVIETKNNLGFAGGINYGLSYIRLNELSSDFYVWILNPDTKIDKNSLPELVKTFNSKTHSVIGSIIKNYSGNAVIATHGEFNPKTGRIITRKNSKLKSNFFYPIGASLFTSNFILKNLGDFDEQYFLYFEELDFVLKGLKKNLKPAVAQNSFIYHSQGATTKNKALGNKNLAMLEFKANGLKKLYANHFPKLEFSLKFALLFKAFTLILKGEFKGAIIFLKVL